MYIVQPCFIIPLNPGFFLPVAFQVCTTLLTLAHMALQLQVASALTAPWPFLDAALDPEIVLT